MRWIIFIFLIGVFLTDRESFVYAQENANAVIRGVVIAEDSGEPLMGAHVFLSGTKMGTVTNRDGYFQIRNITPGSYRLVISIIGFKRITKDLSLSPGDITTENSELTPVVYKLGEIYAGNLDEKWERYLDRFTRLFIGETLLAESVKILNPEVLRFEANWWGRFSAEALAPLKIENRGLGYHITFYLKDFQHIGNRTRWDGDPLFSELTPVNEEEAIAWEQNRREAYLGSLRHFMISLFEDNVEENGFIVFNLPGSSIGYPPQNKFRTGAQQIIYEADEGHLKRIRFSGDLEIIYTEAAEDPMYVQWAPDIYRGPASFRTSFLKLNRRYITIDADGEVNELYGATRSGYYSFQRIADNTPREYRPPEILDND